MIMYERIAYDVLRVQELIRHTQYVIPILTTKQPFRRGRKDHTKAQRVILIPAAGSLELG